MVPCDPESATAVTGFPSTVTSRYKMVPTAPCVPTSGVGFAPFCLPLQGCCDLVFEPAQEALEPFGIRAPEALLSLHPCGHVWIPVQNPYMVSAWLSPSTRLGCVTVLPKIVELICLNPHERNYGITELETLGLVCAQSFSCLFTWSSLCVSCLFTWSSLCGLH